MAFFKPKLPVDEAEFDWLFACFAWLHRALDDAAVLPILALPDSHLLRDAQTAAELFTSVKTMAGMADWDCILEQGDPLREDVQPGLAGEESGAHALGVFEITDDTPVIRYLPSLLNDPAALTATFAHELAHLLTHGLGDPPGGHDLHEHATDCAAAYLGFGVFLANSARQFEQFQDGLMHGWRSQTSGYLSEGALVTATAIFVRLFGIDPAPASNALKTYLRSDFAKTLKYLDWRYPDVPAALVAVDLAEWV